MKFKTVKILELKPNPDNPRAITDDALSDVAASIPRVALPEFGCKIWTQAGVLYTSHSLAAAQHS